MTRAAEVEPKRVTFAACGRTSLHLPECYLPPKLRPELSPGCSTPIRHCVGKALLRWAHLGGAPSVGKHPRDLWLDVEVLLGFIVLTFLIALFVLIASEMSEGDTLAWDRAILVAMRSAEMPLSPSAHPGSVSG
jgi:hypothetical protein